MSEPIYLDYNSTTPVDSEVLDAMLPWMTGQFWNAASTHSHGRRASGAVEAARQELGDAIGAHPREIVFTSGATESDNTAIKGAFLAAPSSRRRVIVGATEHKAVLDTAEWLANQGAEIAIAPVDEMGVVDWGAFCDLLDESVSVVSIMLANNETGVQAPLARLIDAVHEVGALFHTDATQAIGRVPVDLTALGVDLASFSAHKIYGPKGIGVLYVLRGTKLVPLVHGGGHEGGMRSGTLNVPSIVGFGRAAELASKLLQSESDRQSRLVEHLLNNLSARIKGIELNGAAARRLPNTANIRIRGTDGEAVMANAPSVLVSSGSACTSMVPAPSHVLTAMGMDATAAEESLRISVGRPTTTTEIDDAVELLSDAIGRVRDFEGVIIS